MAARRSPSPYISESSLLLPVLQRHLAVGNIMQWLALRVELKRRSALYRPWQFHCQCERCIGFDDTRGHRCSRCGWRLSNDSRLLHCCKPHRWPGRGIQWASADSGVWQACDNCGGHMDDKDGIDLGFSVTGLSNSQELRQCLSQLWLRYNAARADQPTPDVRFHLECSNFRAC